MGSQQLYPGFKALSEEVFLWVNNMPEQENGAAISGSPQTIILFGWGDAQLKHLAKFTTGFSEIFRAAKIIVVLSPIFRAMTQTLDQRVNRMQPVITEAFSLRDNLTTCTDQQSVLIHVMSNTGGLNFAASLEAYQRTFGHPLVHSLLIFDSTPGSLDYSPINMGRMSHAMTIGTAVWFPWPFAVTQALWAVFLYALRGIEIILNRESAPMFSRHAVNNELLATRSARRLYLYSKEDAIIWWEDIETHAAEATAKGYEAECIIFEGSPHVGHMRMWPEKYWGAIKQTWAEVNDVTRTVG